MSNLLVVGLQWGDEGKGKVVDHIARDAQMVVRFSGGGNAGHTIVSGGKKFVLHHLPSGVLYPGVVNVLGERMVINPIKLVEEIEGLKKEGIFPNIKISSRAHAILPEHIKAEEKKCYQTLGTTKQGIGPCHEAKVGRRGKRMRELVNNLEKLYYGPEFFEAMQYLAPMVVNTFDEITEYVTSKQNIIFEGAQGMLLDVDYGTYPYVTSSSINDLGIYFRHVNKVIGVFKPYVTRVGTGPFPTELTDEIGQKLQSQGCEVGSTTGRERRCGWLDLGALKTSSDIAGVNELAITKLDVLNGFEKIKVCTSYRHKKTGIPVCYDDLVDLNDVEPQYIELQGWEQAFKYDYPTPAANDFITYLETELALPITFISTGPGRDQVVDLYTLEEEAPSE